MKQISKVTLIMRNYTYEQVHTVAEVLSESEYVRNLEVTMNTENALDIIKKISESFKDVLSIGAGTVLNIEQLKAAVDSGAMFVLSPTMMSEEMISYCKEHEVISIPGAFTPSEINKMHTLKADIIKVFPSQEVSPSYAFKIKEPLDSVKLMAVGGVNINNINDYLEGAYDYIGTAGGIFSKEDIVNQDIENLKKSLINFENKLKER